MLTTTRTLIACAATASALGPAAPLCQTAIARHGDAALR